MKQVSECIPRGRQLGIRKNLTIYLVPFPCFNNFPTRFRLQKSLPINLLHGVKFLLFNLGDRAYGPQFCAAGRKLAVRFLQLGAQMVGEAGYGDDGTPNGGVFADLDHWIEETLLCQLPPKVNEDGAPFVQGQCPFHVQVGAPIPNDPTQQQQEEWQQERFCNHYKDFFQSVGPLSAYQYTQHRRLKEMDRRVQAPLVGHVARNQRLTPDDWQQNTRHVRIEIQSLNGIDAYERTQQWTLHDLPYLAGDVTSIMPSNPIEEVERFLSVLPETLRMISNCELCISFDSSKVDSSIGAAFPYWPRSCTLKGWLTYCADIHALPEREDLRALSYFCSMDCPGGLSQQEKLISLSETKESVLYADYVLREKRTWSDVLYDFDSLRSDGSQLTIDILFSLLSPIRPRDFSIASSPTEGWASSKTNPSVNLDLCVAVVEGVTNRGRSFHGLCSNYISNLPIHGGRNNSFIRLWIRPGTFQRLPLTVKNGMQMQTPVIYVGSGTGIAPLRGLIRERVAVARLSLFEDNDDTLSLEEYGNVLVFGCRKRNADYYYEKEWNILHTDGQLKILTAFSQEQWFKVYVQQVIQQAEKEDQLLSRHLLERGGALYIAGGPSMARTVREVVVETLTDALGGDEKQAQIILAKLQRQGLFSVEAWG